MSSIVVSAPEISDRELVFDETETRTILKFFWPTKAAAIDVMSVDNDTRRFAQSILIAAIDASYAMGYMEILLKGALWPNRSLSSLAKKLAKNFAARWWKHTQRKDLENGKICESVRREIAFNYASFLELRIQGIASRSKLHPFHLAHISKGPVWG